MTSPTAHASTDDADGATREGLVRAADWRFLFPPPPAGHYDQLVVLGAPAALLDALVAMSIATKVTDRLPTDGSASAVVVLPGIAVHARALAEALAPGGALYVEVDRRLAQSGRLGPANLLHKLRAASISPAGVYAVGRRGLAPRRYIPLDGLCAFAWYLRNIYQPRTAGQWIGRAFAVRVATLHPRLLQALLPAYAVVAVRDHPPSVIPVTETATLCSGLYPAATRPLLFGDGGDRVVALPFARSAPEPSSVLKIPRSAAFHGRTMHEQATTNKLRALLPADLARAIPEPAGIVTSGNTLIATEQYVAGRSLAASSGSWGAPRGRRISDLRITADWLTRFHLATQLDRRAWSERETEEWIDAMFRAYAAAYGVTPAERRLHETARSYAVTLAGTAVPVVWQHRDYAVWNLTRNGDALAVLDWEGARPGPPLCDMLHFITSWDLAIRGARGDAALRCFRSLFLHPSVHDRYHSAAHESIMSYNTSLDLDVRITPILLLHHRLELAIRRSDQLRDRGTIIGNPRSDNQEVAMVTMLADHADALFASAADSCARKRR